MPKTKIAVFACPGCGAESFVGIPVQVQEPPERPGFMIVPSVWCALHGHEMAVMSFEEPEPKVIQPVTALPRTVTGGRDGRST